MMPFFSGYGMVVMPAIAKLGYRFSHIHTDVNKMVQSAVMSSRMLDFDSVVVPFDMTMESQALGNEISLYEDSEDILYLTIPVWGMLQFEKFVDPLKLRKELLDT